MIRYIISIKSVSSDLFNYSAFFRKWVCDTLSLPIDVDRVISESLRRGAKYVDVRFQDYFYELIVIDNGYLREYSVTRSRGIGIRVIINNYVGFASTNIMDWNSIRETIERAITAAKAMSVAGKIAELAEKPITRAIVRSKYNEDPRNVDSDTKVKTAMEVNKEALRFNEIKSTVTRMGCQIDRRVFASSEGDLIDVTTVATGVFHLSVARIANVMERVFDQKSAIAGYEFIERNDWVSFAKEISELAIKASQAKTPPPGTYTVVLDNEIVGLLLHEAFGHASEGDGVEAGASVLVNKINKRVASPLITIVDSGVVKGGYFCPYDDEGVPKKKTIVVDKGILKTYLHSRITAKRLGGAPTGNARAQDYASIPLVRQTNYYIEPGDYKVDELFEDVKFGIYVKGRGATGGEVDSAVGTFTFSVGPSYLITKGEISELVRGVVLSGLILETLKEVDAVANDLKISTSVFGACGKGGQRVRVGDGGPHIRVRRMVIGGR